MRSKGKIDLRELAGRYHGGGHMHASGGKMKSFGE
jgi:nanoRNase/pAp phosphatase (c-di-AMP/oligoRNAs hydrolase)